jgi:hypothetical protein
MDALHVIAFVLQEQTWHSKNTGALMDIKKYVERAKSSVQAILENQGSYEAAKPGLLRSDSATALL